MPLQLVGCPLCGWSASFLDIEVARDDENIAMFGSLYEGATASSWKVCGRCGFVHQNPRPAIAELNSLYSQAGYHELESPYSTDQEYLEFARWYYGEKVDFTLRHTGLRRGRVLDVGCGRGGVLRIYEEKGWATFGVEPDRNLAEFAAKVLKVQDIKQCIFDSTFELRDRVDLVFTNHAFEHFADLDEVMRGLRKSMKPGGYLFIAVPTYFENRSVLSREWMNSAHCSLFTHRSLGSLLAKHGFEEVVHSYRAWKKEVDDLWYLARFTGRELDQAAFFEDPKAVAHYLETVNPLRSFFYFPIYSYWSTRVRVFTALKLLLTNPRAFIRKLRRKLRRGPGL